MNQIFPFANIVVGVLVLIVGFAFHWIGQLVSVINWEYATKIGLQEKAQPETFKVYENGIAKADVWLGWLYGVAGVGLLLDLPWSYNLLWFPGVVLVYHSLSYWYWTANQRKLGHHIVSGPFRLTWTLANLITGLLAVAVAWYPAI